MKKLIQIETKLASLIEKVGVGKYVAACALYTAVLAELTGKSVYEDTTTTITTSGGLGEVNVTAENRALCQACATYAARLLTWNRCEQL